MRLPKPSKQEIQKHPDGKGIAKIRKSEQPTVKKQQKTVPNQHIRKTNKIPLQTINDIS